MPRQSTRQWEHTMSPEYRRISERNAFCLGYEDGAFDQKNISRRQVETDRPSLFDYEIDAYLNGHDDGVRGDTWRYRQITRTA
jgi:hypothetical protein